MFKIEQNTSYKWPVTVHIPKDGGRFVKATFSAESHAMHYDFQWHLTDIDSISRPYVAFGGGVKLYRGTGTEQLTQPLSRFALLTKTQEVKGMASIGVGIKTKIGEHWQFRVDVHDYITPFPKDVITPNLGTQLGGMIHDIVPMAGITWTK